MATKPVKGEKATLVVHTERDSKPVQEVGEDESYTLEVTSSGATIAAPTDLGALHGLQTFLQLVSVSQDGFVAPAVNIKDAPRFPWRGLLIDWPAFYAAGGVAQKYRRLGSGENECVASAYF